VGGKAREVIIRALNGEWHTPSGITTTRERKGGPGRGARVKTVDDGREDVDLGKKTRKVAERISEKHARSGRPGGQSSRKTSEEGNNKTKPRTRRP